MRKGLISALFVFCFCPYFARADTNTFPANCSPTAPDISGWEVVQPSRTEFRISDRAIAYLGLAVEYTDYKNPLNSGEFVRVISRHIPLIPEQKEINERVILDVATTLYNQKEEQERLDKLEKESDSILFMRWRTQEDPLMGRGQRDGDVDLWFLKSSGECLVAKNEKVAIQFLTENVDNGKPRNIFVGVKYQIGDVYHILKVDRRDVLLLMNGEKR